MTSLQHKSKFDKLISVLSFRWLCNPSGGKSKFLVVDDSMHVMLKKNKARNNNRLPSSDPASGSSGYVPRPNHPLMKRIDDGASTNTVDTAAGDGLVVVSVKVKKQTANIVATEI